MSVTEIRMLCWMCAGVIKDRIRSQIICNNVEVMPVEGEMHKIQQRWFEHVKEDQ